MSQFCLSLAFSIEIAVFISVDIVEAVIVGESWEYWGSGSGSICNSLVSEFLEFTVSFEMTRSWPIAITAGVLRAASFGVVRTTAGVAFPAIDGGKGRSYWDGVRASGWGRYGRKWGGWSGFTTTGPSIDLSSAPGYVVVLVGESAVRTVPFLGFGSRCESGECWFGLDRVDRSSRVVFRLFRKDLL